MEKIRFFFRHLPLITSYWFKRFSSSVRAVSGYEKSAFIPYGGYLTHCPKGSYGVVRGEVKSVKPDHVLLKNGPRLEWDYLAGATGSKMDEPWKLVGVSKERGIEKLKFWQRKISDAKDNAILGGGAVGVGIRGSLLR